PLANGVAPAAKPPTEWSETKNVKWKVKIPGFGTSTPIIWENKVFILTAIPKGDQKDAGGSPSPRNDQPTDPHQFVILCLDKATGKTIWQKTAREEVPHEAHHRDHGYASASPVTDGETVLAYFGSRGLYAYDMNGNLKWEKDFGNMRTRNSFGEGASPAMAEGVVVVLWDHEGDDFIVALDQKTGNELWRQKRDEPSNWSTPLIIKGKDRTEVVVNGTGKVRSYDLRTGKEFWNVAGQTMNIIPTPVTDGEKVYVTSGFRGNALQAIKLGHNGDLTGTEAIAWSHNKNTPYVPTPLLYDNFLYVISGNNGVVSIWDTKAGKPLVDAERLEGVRGIYASPVGANNFVYLLGREGATIVVKKGPSLDVVATNKLDDRTDASIAIVGNDIFIRGHANLYCIGN
ncbi:MAG: PQQ-binding-like beta-propeller repeat protein, partial [Verrucomicrobiales bacterium]